MKLIFSTVAIVGFALIGFAQNGQDIQQLVVSRLGHSARRRISTDSFLTRVYAAAWCLLGLVTFIS